MKYRIKFDPRQHLLMWIALAPDKGQLIGRRDSFLECYWLVFGDAVQARRMLALPAPVPIQRGKTLIWDVEVTGEMSEATQASMAESFGVTL